MFDRLGTSVLALCVVGACVHPTSVVSQTYDWTVVEDGPRLSPDSITLLVTGVRDWVATQPASIPPQSAAPAREDLFLAIQSYLHHRGGPSGVSAPDPTLASYFELGTQLGVFGSGLVARWLGQPASEGTPALLPDQPIRLTFEAPDFVLEHEDWWTVRYPLYFMMWLSQTSAPNTVPAELVILSTAHGHHTVAPRTSQATIFIVSSRDASVPELVDEWRANLGIPLNAACNVDPWPVSGLESHICHATPDGILVELGAVQRPEGVVLLAYSGLDGTYQANREHFLALVQGIEWH